MSTMNRRILVQVTAPALIIGLLLFAACLVSAWYINRLQANMANLVSQDVSSLRAAQQLEIHLRQLRFHCFVYLLDPRPDLLARIDQDQRDFESCLHDAKLCLETARRSGGRLEDRVYVGAFAADLKAIEDGYARYRHEFDRLRATGVHVREPEDFNRLAEENPVRHIVDPCRDLLHVNEQRMSASSERSEQLSRQLGLGMLFLGLGGPISGLIIGYSIARGLTRSIYQLSVRVQDMAQRLEQEVGSVSVAADGDIASLDKQLQQVVGRVEEVAERLQRHQRDMLRAEQLSAVGQLAAGVAHEVRNPLTSVKLLVEAALRSPRRKTLTADDLEVIHGEIVRLERTVQDFLDFARPPSPQRQDCDLREVVTQALDLVRVRARQQGVEPTFAPPEQPVTGHVDRGQLCTVLVNLLLNALDAMPQGGRLEIELDGRPGEGIRLRVADTGPGIAPEMAGRLFTPFASSKATGTGLGLSISRRIVEEHSGRLTGGNRPEGGACFTLTLPRTAASGGPTSTTEPRKELHAQPAGH
jgi:signal transduction histidine kinase